MRAIRRAYTVTAIVAVALSLLASTTGAAAASSRQSPFVGIWRAIDFGDGSLMRVTILGPARGPFLITWTESYFSFCDGRAGVAAGKGRLSPDDAQVLEADMHLKCLRSGDEISWQQVWQYRPTYDDLVSQETPGVETIWKRLSQPIVPRATFVAYVPGSAEGYGWPIGHTITLSIPDRAYSTQAVSEQRPDFPEGETRVLFELWRDDLSLDAGDHVFMTDKSIGLTKDVVVTNLAVTDFDASAGTVTGIFDPAFSIWAWLYGQEGQVPATEGGIWTATFGELPPGAWGGATQWDADGDGTSIDFQVPNPRFSFFPEQKYIEGWQWADGATVSASVAGKVECHAEGVSGHPEWDPRELFVSMSFPEGCSVAAGDEVALTGDGTTRTHIVRNLAVTSVDVTSDVVAGAADSGAEVHIWVHDHGESDMRVPVEGGAWEAAFGSIPFDLLPGMCGRSEILDAAGNATAVDWCAPNPPNPSFVAFPEVDQIFGYGWAEGTEVNLSINGQEFQTATVKFEPIDPSNPMAYFDFGNLYNLQPGDTVTLAGSGIERTHTVQNLAVTAVDPGANTVQGTADDGALVHAWVHGYSGSDVEVTTAGGVWTASFGTFKLSEGMCGRSEIRGEQGNSTAVDWCVPPPQGDIWAAAFTYDMPAWSWTEGEHRYRFEVVYSVPDPGGEYSIGFMPLTVSSTAPLYDGFVLLGDGRPLAAIDGGCQSVDAINPAQATRFLLSWSFYFMTPDEAVAHFESITASVIWDAETGGNGPLQRHELLQTDEVVWANYACTYTSS